MRTIDGCNGEVEVEWYKKYLPIKTRVENVDSIKVHHQDITPNASAIRPETILFPASTSCPANVEKSSPSTAPPDPKQRPESPALTPPGPVYPPPPSPSVDFGPGIMEALPYTNIVQEPHPPHMEASGNNLEAMARATVEVLTQVPPMTSFITSRQRGTLGALTESV